MSSHAVVEILPPQPQREADGRFKPGSSANPNGRPAGSPIGFTKKMRDALSESFDQIGGVDYLIMLAFWKPDLYTALLGRSMPIKIAGEDDGPSIRVINRVTRRVIPMPEK